MRRTFVAFACLALLGACSSLPGGSSPEIAAADADPTAQTQIVALETELARLKSQNARLSNELLAMQRDRDRQAAGEAAPTEAQIAAALPPKPELLVEEQGPNVNAVVDDAASPSLTKTDVPVETSPRLVQPTFASNETVFENEAEGDIKTESVLYGVHLASYRKMVEARTGWHQLQRENPEELGLLEPRVEGVSIPGKGDFLRLVGGGFASRDKAEALCAQLKERGLFCSVAGFAGERLSLADGQG